jgi:hypothetical protein
MTRHPAKTPRIQSQVGLYDMKVGHVAWSKNNGGVVVHDVQTDVGVMAKSAHGAIYLLCR